MTSHHKKIEKVYCILVLATFVACLIPFLGPISALLGLVMLTLFPIGIAIECCYGQYPMPWGVALCLILTFLWWVAVIRVNLQLW